LNTVWCSIDAAVLIYFFNRSL
jgi:hypothetical protein